VSLASSTVYVTSGDRTYIPEGGAKDSPHLTKQAADFHVLGMSDSRVDQELKDSTSPVSVGFRLIQHCPYTATDAPHLHLDSRNGPGDPTVFMHEGMTQVAKSVYTNDSGGAEQ
jgi:hypothetical protein